MGSEREYFRATQERKVKMKVLGVLRYWVESHFYDLAEDSELRDLMLDFISSLGALDKEEWLNVWVQQFESILKLKFDELNKEIARTKALAAAIDETPSTGPVFKKFAKSSLFDFPVDEVLYLVHHRQIARQMALIDYENFKKVKPPELLKKNWESARAKELAPNILLITERSKKVPNIIANCPQIGSWVSLLILEGKTEKELQRRANYFIDLMQKLEELHDICGLIDLIGGLKDFHVKRLKDEIWVASA
jgi:hypothetical protein